MQSRQLLDTPWVGEKADEHDARQETAHVRPVRHATTGRRVGADARHAVDQLQRLDNRDLVHRIRALERELETERRNRAALAYDQQALRAKLLRLETEIILLQAERPPHA